MWLVSRSLLGKLLWFGATLAGATLFIQLLLWATPGDPIDLLPNGEELRPALEKEWGLDKPWPDRFVGFVSKALQGDLGTSLTVRPGVPVAVLIGSAIKRSAMLLIPSLFLAMAGALALAFHTAGKPSFVRKMVQLLSVIPVFLLAYCLVIGINDFTFHFIQQGSIQRPGWFALPDQPSWFRSMIAIFVLAVASGSMTELHTSMEDEVMRIKNSGFYEAAIARNGPTFPHVWRNLIAPFTAIATRRITFMVGGLIILEKVLLLNGAGSLLWEAALQRDYPLAIGLTLASAALVVAARFLGDGIRIIVDPRLRSLR